MSFNLFDWIRDGVRQSVLLGVSDAIETIGSPDNGDGIKPELIAMLNQGDIAAAQKKPAATGKKKRLGRSLKDLDSAPAAGK